MKTINKIIILSISLFVIILVSCNAQESSKDQVSASFKVFGNCEMCKKTIENAIDVKGVKSAVWDEHTKIMNVTYVKSKVTEDKLHNLIAATGYDTELVKAKEQDYKNLPECCQYERAK